MELSRALVEVVGSAQVVSDPDAMAAFTIDWTGRFKGVAQLVVSPGTRDEVAEVVRLCSEAGVAVHPQGGNTGLVGGSIPLTRADAVIMRTHRLNWIENAEAGCDSLIAGAGATLESIQQAAQQAGKYYGVDIAARSSATIGGTVATNAGGIRVCAFGMTRDQVLGLEAVLPDGQVVSHLHGLEKDNTGLRWTDLFVGSEGTLGVITAVNVRLRPPVGQTSLFLVPTASIAEAQQIVDEARSKHRLLAAEVMESLGLQIVTQFDDLPPLFGASNPACCVLIEVEGADVDLDLGEETVLAADASDRRRLWHYRELQSEAAGLMAQQYGVAITKLDVSLPQSNLAEFRTECARLLDALPGVHDHYCFGHIADGNLHIEIAAADESVGTATSTVLELVAKLNGSISAEHGIGHAKAEYLHLSRSGEEIALMRSIKSALDPQGLMAPGVIFDAPTTRSE